RQAEGAGWLVNFLRPMIIDALARQALVAVAEGDFERVATLLSTVAGLCEQSGYALDAPLQAGGAKAVKDVRSRVAEATFDGAWETGRGLALDQALAYALQT